MISPQRTPAPFSRDQCRCSNMSSHSRCCRRQVVQGTLHQKNHMGNARSRMCSGHPLIPCCGFLPGGRAPYIWLPFHAYEVQRLQTFSLQPARPCHAALGQHPLPHGGPVKFLLPSGNVAMCLHEDCTCGRIRIELGGDRENSTRRRGGRKGRPGRLGSWKE